MEKNHQVFVASLSGGEFSTHSIVLKNIMNGIRIINSVKKTGYDTI